MVSVSSIYLLRLTVVLKHNSNVCLLSAGDGENILKSGKLKEESEVGKGGEGKRKVEGWRGDGKKAAPLMTICND